MDYLQYKQSKEKKRMDVRNGILNLVINGLPSIQQVKLV